MKINIRQDHVEVEGYVNAVERDSKPLMSRIGQFIERICKGAFGNAIKRNDDIHILLNHDWARDLGSTKQGNLELEEDNIGLKARAKITDPEVIKSARNGDLVGWSFGFQDREVEHRTVDGIINRLVKDLDLFEVSILDRTKVPAYDGTLITARSENNEVQLRGEEFIDKVEVINEELKEQSKSEEVREKPQKKPQEAETKKEVPKEYYLKLWSQIKNLEE